MSRFISWLMALVPCLIFSSCDSDVEDYYAHERAFLRFTPVSAVHTLHAALNSPGTFCQITVGTKTYDFKGADGKTQSYIRTALDQYGRPECVAGFVVGIPSVPDLNMRQQPVAYDLVCPTCYYQNQIQRSLNFTDTEELTCPRCHRVYNLKNGGMLQSGDTGEKRLLQYHITYTGDLVLVTN